MTFVSALLVGAVCFRVPTVIPASQEMSCRTNEAVRIVDGLKVFVACPDAAAGAAAGWGSVAFAEPEIPFGASPIPHPFATHWRQVGWDMVSTPKKGLTGGLEEFEMTKRAVQCLKDKCIGCID